MNENRMQDIRVRTLEIKFFNNKQDFKKKLIINAILREFLIFKHGNKNHKITLYLSLILFFDSSDWNSWNPVNGIFGRNKKFRNIYFSYVFFTHNCECDCQCNLWIACVGVCSMICHTFFQTQVSYWQKRNKKKRLGNFNVISFILLSVKKKREFGM